MVESILSGEPVGYQHLSSQTSSTAELEMKCEQLTKALEQAHEQLATLTNRNIELELRIEQYERMHQKSPSKSRKSVLQAKSFDGIVNGEGNDEVKSLK